MVWAVFVHGREADDSHFSSKTCRWKLLCHWSAFGNFASACLSVNSGASCKFLNNSVLSVFKVYHNCAKKLKAKIIFLSLGCAVQLWWNRALWKPDAILAPDAAVITDMLNFQYRSSLWETSEITVSDVSCCFAHRLFFFSFVNWSNIIQQ